jgi:hypothetical protein
VARYADACNINGSPDVVAHKISVLHRHCREVGRDPAEIEVTTSLGLADEVDDPDEVVRQAEVLAALGVDTVMARPVGPEPAGYLEKVWGPAIPELNSMAGLAG